MDFPQESIDLARNIVSKYRKRSTAKRDLAARIYDKHFYQIGYGFSESLKTGNCGRYLHEIVKEAECYTMAGVIYLLAREAGLKPRLFSARGMRDVKEGKDKEKKGKADHSFVIVETGSKKGKPLRTIVDPDMVKFGKVTLHPERNQMEIYDFEKKELTTRDYDFIEEISQDEYLRKLEENRTFQGGKDTLEATQRIKGINENQVHITYIPKTRELKTSLHFSSYYRAVDKYGCNVLMELTSPIEPNGEFHPEKGTYSQFKASAAGWTEHSNPQVPMSFKLQDTQGIFSIFDYFIKSQGYKSRPSKLNHHKLRLDMIKQGLRLDFSTDPGSVFESIIQSPNFSDSWRDFQKFQKRIARRYVKEVTQDEISFKTFLRDAHGIKARRKATSEKNKEGHIYTKEEHIDFLRQRFEDYSDDSRELIGDWLRDLEVKAKLVPGSSYHSERKVNRNISRKVDQMDSFEMLKVARQEKDESIFHDVAEGVMLIHNFDIERPISQLEKGLTKKDLLGVAQDRLLLYLVNAWGNFELLSIKQYRRGLQRILAIA